MAISLCTVCGFFVPSHKYLPEGGTIFTTRRRRSSRSQNMQGYSHWGGNHPGVKLYNEAVNEGLREIKCILVEDYRWQSYPGGDRRIFDYSKIGLGCEIGGP